MLKSRALGYGTDKTSLFSATPLIDQGRFSGLKPSLVLFPFTISLIMNEPPNMGLSEATGLFSSQNILSSQSLLSISRKKFFFYSTIFFFHYEKVKYLFSSFEKNK